jgi:hypothetical protein
MGPEFKLIKSSFRAASPLCWTMDERKPTPSRSLGTQSRAVLRVAGTRTGKNRWVTAGNVSRVLHVLWLEVTGLLFLFLALVGGGAAVKEYHLHAAGSGSAGKSLLAAFFAVVFAYFGVSSFWRSRRRQR